METQEGFDYQEFCIEFYRKFYKKGFKVRLEPQAYYFYSEIAKFLKCPIEHILSDMLNKYAKVTMEKAAKEEDEDEYKD